MKHPRYRLELEALPSEQDADQRLKRLLKFALRSLRLKCRHVSLVEAEQEKTAP